jgi:hypothetical protein
VNPPTLRPVNPTTKQRLIRAALWAGLAGAWVLVAVCMIFAAVSMSLLQWTEKLLDRTRQALGIENPY